MKKKSPVSRSGRFASGPGADVAVFSESISFDWRLWRQDLLGSMAHATMLQKIGVLTKAEIGLDAHFVKGQYDRKLWPQLREAMAAILRGKTRDEWCALLEGSDACFAPVLSMAEASQHAHARTREAFIDIGGVVQSGPAPRFDRSTPDAVRPAPAPGEHTDQVLAEAGFSADEIAALHAAGVARRG